jgi:hypothetical protein
MKYKARELARSYKIMQHNVKAGMGWTVLMTHRNGFSSYNFAVISLPAECRENSGAFQQDVTRLQKKRTITS